MANNPAVALVSGCMRHTIAVTVLAVLAVTVAAVSASPASAAGTITPDRFSCATKRPSRTLVRTVDGRVLAIDVGFKGDYRRTKVYVCATRTGKIHYMGLDVSGLSDDTSPSFLRRIMAPNLSPLAVAWVIQVVDPDTGTSRQQLRQISLNSGRLLRSATVRSAFVRPLQADNGYLAWIDQAPNGSCTPTCSLHLFNPRGDHVIDSGADIESDSLSRDPGPAVGGSTTVGGAARLWWIKGGVARTALYRD
jgi:hypothetical protein